MQNLPRVSIITPTYNQAEYLAETIDSVLTQDYPNIEYIVIDDGSTDTTPDILRRYKNSIRSERHDNIGQARTLNKGWEISNGSILGYLSSDDILYPGAIRKLVEILENDNFIVCAYPDADVIDHKSRIVKKNVCRPFDLAELVVRQECHIGPGALFRRAAFNTAGGWKAELKLAPDREFWIRLATYGRFEFCRDVLAGYRMHPDSISYKDVSEQVGREYLWVLDQYFEAASIPSEIAARKSEAYGYAQLVLARNCFRAGQFKRGKELYKEACRLHSSLSDVSVKARIFRNVVSKPARIALSTFRSFIKG
ncbi:MAG: glycosyltransferase [Glaciimonas sp.]|nr:glycosyltransferase [Glaciimonas sp.]